MCSIRKPSYIDIELCFFNMGSNHSGSHSCRANLRMSRTHWLLSILENGKGCESCGASEQGPKKQELSAGFLELMGLETKGALLHVSSSAMRLERILVPQQWHRTRNSPDSGDDLIRTIQRRQILPQLPHSDNNFQSLHTLHRHRRNHPRNPPLLDYGGIRP